MTTATVRWIHSIQALASSSGGMSWPWQSGQSGQPRPESVARTMTPIVTSTRVVTRVARARCWKRVTRRPFYRGGGASPGPSRYACRRCVPIGSILAVIPARHAASRRCGTAEPTGVPARRRRRVGVLGALPARLRRRAPAPASMEGWSAAADPAVGLPVARLGPHHVRSGADPALAASTPRTGPSPRRTGPRRSRSTTSARTRRRRSSTVDGAFIWAIEGERGHLHPRRRPAGGRHLGRRVHDRRPRAARPETIRRRPSRCSTPRPWSRSASRAPAIEDADPRRRRAATSRRSPPTRRPTRPSTRPRSPTRWRRTSRSSSSSRRRSSARAPSAARRSTGSSRSPPPTPSVTFINVEPYQLQTVDGQLQPVLDANGQLQATDVDRRVGPLLRAVDLRGRPDRASSAAPTSLIATEDELTRRRSAGDQRR